MRGSLQLWGPLEHEEWGRELSAVCVHRNPDPQHLLKSPHFTGMERETQRKQSDLPKVTQLIK